MIIVGKGSGFTVVVDSFSPFDCEGEGFGDGFWSGDLDGAGDSEGVEEESDSDGEIAGVDDES